MADRHIPTSEIRKAWLDPGLTTAEAAAKVGLARSSLWRRAKALGLPPRKAGRRFAHVDQAEFRELWLADVTTAEIARRFGIHRMTVWSLRHRLDLPARPAGGFKRRVTLEDFSEGRLAQAMAVTAAREVSLQHALGLVDIVRGRIAE